MAGGIIGALGLTLAIPLARPLVLSFGSPELFMLTVLGVALAAVLSRGNVAKGLAAGLLGLLLGTVGTSPTTAEYRFTFGSLFLGDGLSLVAVALGIFGLAEIATRVGQRGHTEQPISLGGSYRDGIREWLTHWTQVIRGALIGIWAGVLPGIGATAGTWLAYGQAVATAKDKRKFGKGDPRGIVGRRVRTTPSRPVTSSPRCCSASPAVYRRRCCSACCLPTASSRARPSSPTIST
jgi:putative tricarboxylic transport membrane protein